MGKTLDKIVGRVRNRTAKKINAMGNLIAPPFFCAGETYIDDEKEIKLNADEIADGMSNILSHYNPIYLSGNNYNKKNQ